MTRKDYELIAEAFRRTKPLKTEIPEMDQWDCMVNQMKSTLGNQNPRFDKAKFVKACREVPQ